MAKANGPRRIGGLLGSTALAPLVQRARQSRAHGEAPAEKSKQALTDLLPPALRDRCHLVLQDDVLIMITETSAAAQLLRFQGPRLARQLGAARWRVRVSPLPAPGQQAPAENAPNQMPAEAAACLRAVADNIDDEALQDSLRRLARHGEPEQ